MSIGADKMLSKADAWKYWVNTWHDKSMSFHRDYIEKYKIDLGKYYDEGYSVDEILDYIDDSTQGEYGGDC